MRGTTRIFRSILANAALTLLACNIGAASARAASMSLKVVGLDCAECAQKLEKSLSGIAGVDAVRVDWKGGNLAVAGGSVSPEAVTTAVESMGYDVAVGTIAATAVKRGGDVQQLTDASRRGLRAALVPGKVTVVEVGAEWCGPCHTMERILNNVAHNNRNVAVRRIDVGRWDNAAALEIHRQFGVDALPYVRVYDGQGKLLMAATGLARVCRMTAAIADASAAGGAVSATSQIAAR